MIVQQNVQAKITATFGANHLRLYLVIFFFNFPDRDIKIVQILDFGYNLLEPLLVPIFQIIPQDFLHYFL